jgi:hypothetical protein
VFISPIKFGIVWLLFLRTWFIFNDYAGGGVALVYASNSLDKLEIANFDQKIGVQIIQNALKVWEKLIIYLVVFSLSCVLISEISCRYQCTRLL